MESESTTLGSKTQEWTPANISELAGFKGESSVSSMIDKICDAHNAALAAEWEKHRGMEHHMEACRSLLHVPDDEVLYQAIKDLQQQLAAERLEV